MNNSTRLLAALTLASFPLHSANASLKDHSAVRQPGEHASERLLDLYFAISDEHHEPDSTAAGQAVPFEQLNLAQVPILASKPQIDALFRAARDRRDWEWDDMRGFARRISWLYPQDGCYLRSRLMTDLWSSNAGVLPAQAFVFGDMKVSTPYGETIWWYHVAPVFSDGTQVYVLDASMDPERPMTLREWAGKTTSDRVKEATFAICAAYANWPESECSQTMPISGDGSESLPELTQEFLANEWRHLTSIGKDPAKLLGDQPPWNHSAQ